MTQLARRPFIGVALVAVLALLVSMAQATEPSARSTRARSASACRSERPSVSLLGRRSVVALVTAAALTGGCATVHRGEVGGAGSPMLETHAPSAYVLPLKTTIATPQGLVELHGARKVDPSRLSADQHQHQHQQPAGSPIEYQQVSGWLKPHSDLPVGEVTLPGHQRVRFSYSFAVPPGSFRQELVDKVRKGLPLEAQHAMSPGDVVALSRGAVGPETMHVVVRRRPDGKTLRQTWTEDHRREGTGSSGAPLGSDAALSTEPPLGQRGVKRWASQLLGPAGELLDQRLVRSGAWLPETSAKLGVGERLQSLAQTGEVDIATLTFRDGREFHYVVGELMLTQQGWFARARKQDPRQLRVELNGWRGPEDPKTTWNVNLRLTYPNGRTSAEEIERARRLLAAYGASEREAPWRLVHKLRREQTSVDLIGSLPIDLGRLTAGGLGSVTSAGASELQSGLAETLATRRPAQIAAALYAGLAQLKELDPDLIAALGRGAGGELVGGVIGTTDETRRVMFVRSLASSAPPRVAPRVLEMMEFQDRATGGSP
jgi:hypothetical protein